MHGGGHAWQGEHVWQGRHVWQGACVAGGVHGREACMVGGMHGRRACMVGGHAWQGGVHGRGQAWQEAGHACPPPPLWQILRDMVNERAVLILLECILVYIKLLHSEKMHFNMTFSIRMNRASDVQIFSRFRHLKTIRNVLGSLQHIAGTVLCN